MMRIHTEIVAVAQGLARRAGQLDVMMLLGFCAAFAAISFFFFQRRSRKCMFVFASSLAACGVYGLLSGVWPLALVQFVLAGNRFVHAFTMAGGPRIARIPNYHVPRQLHSNFARDASGESRMNRLFGSV